MMNLRTVNKPSADEVKLDVLTDAYNIDTIDQTVSTEPHFLFHGTVPKPNFILSGEGARIETDKGTVIDFSSMVLNCVLGQNDPWVKAHQIAYSKSSRPSFTSISLGGHEIYYTFPQRLAKLQIGRIKDPVVNFRQCNGSDAVELAILAAYAHEDKKAQEPKAKKRNLLVSFKGSYHGQSLMAYLVSDTQNENVFLVPKAEHVVKFLDIPPHAENIDCEILTPEEQKVLKNIEELSKETFAVLIEPIQMNSGAHAFSKAFLKAINDICKKNEICFILDEIQTGMGWLGSLTAAERHQLEPDIIALSKGLTAGYGPLALIIATRKYNYLPDRTCGKTQGADIRSLIAANAVLDRLAGLPKDKVVPFATGKLKEELCSGLLGNAKIISQQLDEHLKELKQLFPNNIGAIRGCEAIRVIQIINENTKLPDKTLANTIHLAGPKNGIFIRNCGTELMIKPPLTITSEELKLGFNNLINTMKGCLAPKNATMCIESKQNIKPVEVKPEAVITKANNDILENFVRQKMKMSTKQLKEMGTFKISSMPQKLGNKTLSYDDMSIVRRA